MIRMMGPLQILKGNACSFFAFQNAVGAFPPETADIRPAVVFRNCLFPEEELAHAVVLVRGDVPMYRVLQVTDKGAAMIPPVLIDLFNGRLQGRSVDSQRMDHWRTVSSDPGIVESRVLSVCYDCLCLMALFRAVIGPRVWLANHASTENHAAVTGFETVATDFHPVATDFETAAVEAPARRCPNDDFVTLHLATRPSLLISRPPLSKL